MYTTRRDTCIRSSTLPFHLHRYSCVQHVSERGSSTHQVIWRYDHSPHCSQRPLAILTTHSTIIPSVLTILTYSTHPKTPVLWLLLCLFKCWILLPITSHVYTYTRSSFMFSLQLSHFLEIIITFQLQVLCMTIPCISFCCFLSLQIAYTSIFSMSSLPDHFPSSLFTLILFK